MMMMKISSSAILLLALVVATTTNGFSPLVGSARPQNVCVSLAAEPPQQPSSSVGAGLTRFFGVVAAASVLAWAPLPTPAVAEIATAPFSSSSVQVAETIRTLDMTMPTYGDLKDPKSSAENVPSLTVAPPPKPAKVASSRAAVAVVEQSVGDGEPTSNFASAFLPSMNKKGPRKVGTAAATPQKVSASASYDFNSN